MGVEWSNGISVGNVITYMTECWRFQFFKRVHYECVGSDIALAVLLQTAEFYRQQHCWCGKILGVPAAAKRPPFLAQMLPAYPFCFLKHVKNKLIVHNFIDQM